MKSVHKLSIFGLVAAIAGMGIGVQVITSDNSVQNISYETSSSDVTEGVQLTTQHVQPSSAFHAQDGSSEPISDAQSWQTQLPRQFSDTEVLGSFRVDEHGNLIPDTQTRQVFDYFFTAQDDASIEQIKEWLTSYIHDHLKPPASDQALALLGNYMDYKSQLNELSVDQGVWDRLYGGSGAFKQEDFKSLSQVFADRQGLQRQLFDQETQQALFGKDNQYDDYMLQRLQVSVSDLPKEEIQRQLADIDKQQNPEMQSVREASQVALKHRDLGDSLGQADDAEKYQVYSQTYGDEAANRLMALQEKRQAFKDKRAQYVAFKDSSPSSAALNDYMKHELLLTDGEIQRMQSLDKLDVSQVQ